MEEQPYQLRKDNPTKSEKHPYVIDTTKISGEGDFPCPKCGTKISPDDETEENYTILEPKVKDDELVELILQCNKCGSYIKLTGFPTKS